MSILYNRIEALCGRKSITITQMCKDAGVSRASLTDLKMNRKQSLSSTTLSKIALYFGVSVDYLLGHNETKKQPADASSADELDLTILSLVKQLPEEQKRFLLAQLRGVAGEK
jgi:transcriptional regulator with XRE-family HTH domain